MKREKKICLCFTPHRIVVAILLVTSLVNLLIVGAVVEAASTDAPTVTPSQIDQEPTTTPFISQTLTAFAPTATPWETFTPASDSTETAAPTLSLTPTETATRTSSPTPTACAVKSYWPYLYVQRGDTLYSLARATGSTVDELMQANCLTSPLLHAGQLLYVPRLPVPILTPTAASVPTDFQRPTGGISTCARPFYVHFSVLPIDPEGIRSVTVIYRMDGDFRSAMQMESNGETYYASGYLSEEIIRVEVLYYYFSVLDGFGNTTDSIEYKSAPSPCQGG